MFFALTEHLKNLVRSILAMQYIDLTRALISSSSERTLLIVTPRYLILFKLLTKLCYLTHFSNEVKNNLKQMRLKIFQNLRPASFDSKFNGLN